MLITSLKIKKMTAFLLALLILYFQGYCLSCKAEESSSNSPVTPKGAPYSAKIEINKENENKNIFTGENKEIKPGTQINMTVSNVLSSGVNEQGDEFFAEVANDVNTDGGILIPAGTIAHGKVTKLSPSKRMGRDAYIKLDFDYLITPDGREIPIEASMTTQRNPAVSVAKVAMQDTAYTLAGGVIGGLLALKYLGVAAAVASHGYTVVGGAGVGAVVGAAGAISRKGGEVLIAPGDEIKVTIASEMQLPVMSEDALKDEEKILDGLEVKITGYKLEKDPFGELNTITLSLDIDNRTPRTFSSFDMALVNDYKAVYYPSLFGNTEMWFQKIEPNSRILGKLSFAVDNPKRKHWLIFYDTSSRKPLAKISVNNAQRKLKKDAEKKQ